jgi:hypothetical protein
MRCILHCGGASGPTERWSSGSLALGRWGSSPHHMVSVVEGITHRHVEQAALCTWCLGSAASGARTSRPTASNLTPTGCSARSSGAMRACCVRDNHGPDVVRGGGGSLHAGRRWELVWPSSQQRWRQAAFYRAQASHLARRASCTCVQRMQVDVGVDGVALGLAAARGGAWDVDLLVGCAGGRSSAAEAYACL